jgi:hypothetical protein
MTSSIAKVTSAIARHVTSAKTSNVSSAEATHVTSAEPTHVTSAETAHVTSATAHVTSATAHVTSATAHVSSATAHVSSATAAPVSSASATAAACLCTRRKQSSGKHGACQYHHCSTSHNIFPPVAELPPALPLCASANVPESAKAVAGAIVLSFIVLCFSSFREATTAPSVRSFHYLSAMEAAKLFTSRRASMLQQSSSVACHST